MKHRLTASGLLLVLAAAVLTVVWPSSATAARTPGCTSADLHASYRYSDAGTGHVWGWIVLENRSSHACRTGGFSGISYVGGGNGTQVGSPARWVGTPATYTLRPGQRLREKIQETRAANYPRATCRPRHVDGFRVYVPDSTRSQFVPHVTTGCANRHVRLLEARPLRRP